MNRPLDRGGPHSACGWAALAGDSVPSSNKTAKPPAHVWRGVPMRPNSLPAGWFLFNIRTGRTKMGKTTPPARALTDPPPVKCRSLDDDIRARLHGELLTILEREWSRERLNRFTWFTCHVDRSLLHVFQGFAAQALNWSAKIPCDGESQIRNSITLSPSAPPACDRSSWEANCHVALTGCSDRGAGNKPRNEDACVCSGSELASGLAYCLTVADGVGGVPFGDFAASCASTLAAIAAPLALLDMMECPPASPGTQGAAPEPPISDALRRAARFPFLSGSSPEGTRPHARLEDWEPINARLSELCSAALFEVERWLRKGRSKRSVKDGNLCRSLKAILEKQEAFQTTLLLCLIHNGKAHCEYLGNGGLMKISASGELEKLWFPDPDQPLVNFLGPKGQGTPKSANLDLDGGEGVVLTTDGVGSFELFQECWATVLKRQKDGWRGASPHEFARDVEDALCRLQVERIDEALRDNFTVCIASAHPKP